MKLVVFDCDGTMVDSQHIIVEAMERAFRSAGLVAPVKDQVLSVVGLSLVPAVKRLLPEEFHDRAVALADDYKAAFGDLRRSPSLREPLYLGVRETIAALSRDPNVILGIATGKSRRGVAAVLEREALGDLFATIQTADTHPSKPDPSMLFSAMAETGCEPHETIMIGDTVYDIDMAVAAGAAAVGVAWGYHAVSDLRAAGANVIVENGHDLSTSLQALITAIPEAKS